VAQLIQNNKQKVQSTKI